MMALLRSNEDIWPYIIIRCWTTSQRCLLFPCSHIDCTYAHTGTGILSLLPIHEFAGWHLRFLLLKHRWNCCDRSSRWCSFAVIFNKVTRHIFQLNRKKINMKRGSYAINFRLLSSWRNFNASAMKLTYWRKKNSALSQWLDIRYYVVKIITGLNCCCTLSCVFLLVSSTTLQK